MNTFINVHDKERIELIECATKIYVQKVDEECENIADYTIHDALYDAEMELGTEMLNDDGEGFYDCLVEDLRYKLGID